MRASTSSVPSLRSAPAMASTEPCTSPLTTQRELLAAGLLELLHHLLEGARGAGGAQRLAALAHAVVGDLAGAASLSTTANGSPASGAESKPRISTGTDGPASATISPRSSMSARTRPHAVPATTISPTLSVPRCTSTVPTGPRPRSSLASITTPSAERSGLAFSSQQLGLQGDRLEQLVEAGLLQGRHLDLERLARHALDHDLVLQQRGAHAVGVGARLVDLVDGDDQRHAGGLGVIDGLHRLRHDAVVGGDHEHDDVGDLGAALRAWR